jgi:hypothetical protein
MADLIENLGFADGISGNSIKMFLDGVPVLALQNFNWKIKKGKKPLFGAGFKTAHGVTRSAHKIYEIDFEIKEILFNSAINVAQTAKNAAFLSLFEDFTDVRNAVIIIIYPGAAILRSKTFTGVEITDQEGGFSDSEDAEPIGIKCSGFATRVTGLF